MHYADEYPTAYHRERTAALNGEPEQTVDWTAKGLKVTRLRLLSDRGHPEWDLSYCHGVLNGKPVRVNLPFINLPKGKVSKTIVEHAKRDGVYAKRLGILDCVSAYQ